MSLQNCTQHNLLKEYICAKNQCNQLICKQCFIIHAASLHGHNNAVKLCFESKEFFLQWTEYILKKIVSFSEIVTHMGYSKIFQLKLDPNHPKGTVSQLNFQDIEKVAIQALEEHRKITEGNLLFIQGTQKIEEMIHPEFLKDLYNIACQDAKFNLDILLTNFKKKLVESFPHKEIYRYAKFEIIFKELFHIDIERQTILRDFEKRIMLKVEQSKSVPIKSNSSSTVTNLKKEEIPRPLPREYISPSQSPYKNTKQSQQQRISKQQQEDINNVSTLSNPSSTPKDASEIPRLSDVPSTPQEKPSYEQLASAVSFLKSNELMYQERIITLENRVGLLRNEVDRLTPFEKRVKELEKQISDKLTSSITVKPEERIAQELTRQVELEVKNQVDQLQKVQATLIEENRKLNHTMKDLEDIAEGRSRTITELQEQIKTMSSNIILKQKSIQQLNQLISNQEEEITYRENQVDILGQQIKKLLEKISFLEKSIHELNNLVSNEQEEISYRQNEAQTLEKQVKKLLEKIAYLQKSIHQLNNLIANEEEEISYRENETETLQGEVKKLLGRIAMLEKSIRELNNLIANEEEELTYRENQSEILTNQVHELIQKYKTLESQCEIHRQKSEKTEGQLKNLVEINKGQLNQIMQKNLHVENLLKNQMQKNNELQTQLNASNEGINQLKSELNVTLENNKNLELERNGFIKIVKGLQTELETSQEKINGYNVIVKGLETQLHSKRHTTHQLQVKLDETSEKTNFTESQLSTIQDRNKLLQNQLKIASDKSKLLEAQIELMNEKYRLLQGEIKSADEKIRVGEDLLRTERNRSAVLEAEVMAIRDELVNVKTQMNVAADELKKLRHSALISSVLAKSKESEQSIDEQLLEQVVVMESELSSKTDDISLLVKIVQDYLNNSQNESGQNAQVVQNLQKLKTIRIDQKFN